VPEEHSASDVKHYRHEESNPDNPEEFTEILKKQGIGIDRIQTKENGEVPQQVADHKNNKDNTSYGHDPFASDGGRNKRTTCNAGRFGRGRRTTHYHEL